MIFRLFLLYVSFLPINANATLPQSSVTMDPNTILVLWGTRHGNRHPEKFLDENPRTWGFEGSTELTAFGKRQAFGLGHELREFLGEMVGSNYNRSEVQYFSSSASRCQMTLQAAVAGFHEPSGWADWNTQRHDWWSPVPYSINDQMLRMYSVKECPNSDKVWEPISTDSLSSLASLKRESAQLREYVSNLTHWKDVGVSEMADLADNLIEIDLYNASYPTWIENPTLAGYDAGRMKKEILEFAEAHQIACADYAPCGDLMAGVWLEEIVDRVKRAQKKEEGPRVVGYASHTEITLSAMKLMGVVKDELTTSAGFVLEYREVPAPSIRILNHDPNPIDQHVIYRAEYIADLERGADSDGFIPLSDFLEFVAPKTISDWKTACGQSPAVCSPQYLSRDVSQRTSVAIATPMTYLTLAVSAALSLLW